MTILLNLEVFTPPPQYEIVDIPEGTVLTITIEGLPSTGNPISCDFVDESYTLFEYSSLTGTVSHPLTK